MSEETTEEVKNPEAVLAELRRAQEDLKNLRQTLSDRDSQVEALTTQVESLNTDEMRKKALVAETKLALQAQGIKDGDRLIGYIGTDDLSFDDNGAVTGLKERLEVLKKDLPEVFDAKVRAGGKADIHADNSVEPGKDFLREAVHQAINRH